MEHPGSSQKMTLRVFRFLFCFETSEPEKNVLNLSLFFKQFQPRHSHKICSYIKKCKRRNLLFYNKTRCGISGGIIIFTYRNSRLQIFFKIVVLKNFTNFTEKHLCWSLFIVKL